MQSLRQGNLLQGGKYRIESTLGQGGFGITYLAIQVLLGRKVAIKEFFMKEHCSRDANTSFVSVPSEGSRDLVERFRSKFIKEAHMIASLSNPHIIKIHDVFEENGTTYYVMEYMPGDSLKDKVERAGIAASEAENYIRQICSALEYLHKQNILHLDIKPSNILFDKAGNAVLIDFGISKHYNEDGGQTSSTPVGISKGYAPLEQYQQGNMVSFTPATDIYSLGATLYYMVTGKVPPEASVVNEYGLDKPPGISDRIWNVIQKAMQPKRKDRPQSIKEFLALLESDVKETEPKVVDETIVLMKPGIVSHRQSPISPKRYLFIVSIIVIIGLVIFLILWKTSQGQKTYEPEFHEDDIPQIEEVAVGYDDYNDYVEETWDSCAYPVAE